MSSIYEAYDLPIDNLAGFYRRINKPVTFPDGMTLTLDVVFWGEEKHLEEIEQSIPRLLERDYSRFSEAYQAIRTPGRAKKVEEEAGISKGAADFEARFRSMAACGGRAVEDRMVSNQPGRPRTVSANGADRSTGGDISQAHPRTARRTGPKNRF